MSFSISWTDFPEKSDDKNFLEYYSLKKCKEKSILKKDSKVCHIFIEGDNYPALKLLLSEYKEKVDLIYTDPPYNTGKKFTYKDNKKIDEWLSFMQRRLTLAKELLKDSGCIFISIGEERVHLLKILCDTIFGEENFINDFMWLHGKGKKDSWSRTMQESNLCYAKNKKKLKPFVDLKKTDWAKTNADNDKRGKWFSGSISFDEKRSNPNNPNFYEIISPSGIPWKRQWLVSKEEMNELLRENKIYWGKAPKYSNVPRKKVFNGETVEIIPQNIIDVAESTRAAQTYLDNLLGEKNVFDNPKPVNLIEHFIKIANMNKNAIILDFFAGSGSALEATVLQNNIDGGNRKCILIQKAEKIEKPGNEKDGKFETISELCYERVKKVLNKTSDSLEYFYISEKS